MRYRTLLAVVSLFVLTAGLPASAEEVADGPEPWEAEFEGDVVDLREGWGEATACAVWDISRVECFRTEAALVARAAEMGSGSESGVMTESSTCSYSLRLYDGTSYTGSALYLYQRTVWINLSNYGWANRTSSFKIGACSAYFADYPNGGGAWYPSYYTEAWDVQSSMISGWNNRVSSVYIR